MGRTDAIKKFENGVCIMAASVKTQQALDAAWAN